MQLDTVAAKLQRLIFGYLYPCIIELASNGNPVIVRKHQMPRKFLSWALSVFGVTGIGGIVSCTFVFLHFYVLHNDTIAATTEWNGYRTMILFVVMFSLILEMSVYTNHS